MTPAELRALLEKATPGPFHCEGNATEYEVYTDDLKRLYIHVHADGGWDDMPRIEDLRLMCALRNAAPALSACVDALQSIHDNPDGARETARAALRALEAA